MKPIVAVLACGFVLSGCGGGGGGGSSGATMTPTTSTSVSGVASKGLIKQAAILVCRIVNGSPEPDASCASGTTGADGSFSVTLSDGFTGPIMVKVMAAAGSMMTDETTGTDVPFNMTLRAVVPSVSASTVVNVTPFSEMAANGAVLSMPMDATKITQSIATVQNLMTTLGIDLSVMPMVDLRADGSNPTKLGLEANMVKQLARVAMAAKNSTLMKNSIGASCNTQATVQDRFACAVSFMASVMTSFAGSDTTRAAAMMAALNAQSPTLVDMPMRLADGSVRLQMTDMTSALSIQSAMQSTGMTTTTAANTANTMMGGMM